ncbi:hypothetical protein LOC68_24820 [Blastopirellula sp. JC732]|uniref:Uncharacterized protein n=1 Tax=Blastopirellula sediminis TaxID=2894196 RepID=A0A9X1SIH9_9BACT|nr:hypothetical protein [Blastopirellula sediminis]MCC9605067.1 hypothetical protein [Blastopirellula sediminis]MCC9631633.1 hypothetical protein [Blastopirellula sediminis]
MAKLRRSPQPPAAPTPSISVSAATPEPRPQPRIVWSGAVRGWVSVFILLHVTALFVGPWASPPPSSYLSQQVEKLYEPYLRTVFLKDHGYRFFAPNPGASHLVRYELLDADGKKLGEGRFPNLEVHWPRLLYHRHFMISESLNNVTSIPAEAPPADAPADVRASYEKAVRLRDSYFESIARYLAYHYDAPQVKLILIEHGIPHPLDVAEGMPLSDPSLYREREVGIYQRDDMVKKEALPTAPKTPAVPATIAAPPKEAEEI